jgi:hypothetical protein
MSYVSNSHAWFNLPGIVAAYQPIGAPDPVQARYNQAHGGDNRYKATDGVAPTWHGAAGWTFNGSTQYLATGYAPLSTAETIIVRFSGGTTSAADYILVGSADTGAINAHVIRQTNLSAQRLYRNGTAGLTAGASVASGVMGFSGSAAYLNGLTDGTISGLAISGTALAIGAVNSNGTILAFYLGSIQAVAIYNRTLSPAEMFAVSRQMAHVERNPDWSAWGRRRKWISVTQAEAVLGPGQLTNYGEDAALDALLTGTLYIALYSTAPGETGGGTELTGNNYARTSISAWDGNGTDTRTNTSNIDFPAASADWAEVTHLAILDASSGGNMIFYGTLTTPVTCTSGKTFRIAAGDLSITAA